MRPELNHPVVLVAEDNENEVEMLRRAFDHLGFATPVLFVRDGEQAIAYLAGKGRYANRDEFPLPDLLLLDLKMPRKNGFEVLEWIRSQPSLSRLRTVILTTSEATTEINRGYALGAASFLTKPLNFTEFKDLIFAVHNYWLNINKSPGIERPSIFNPFHSGASNEDLV